MPDTRPVWPTREQRDLLALCIYRYPWGKQLIDQWDAAPADSVRIAAKAILDADTSSTLNRSAKRLLRALGMP